MPLAFVSELICSEIMATQLNFSELRQRKVSQTLHQLHNHASAVLSLTLQWKELEDQHSHAHSLIEERAKELRSMEESILESYKQVAEREKQVELMEKAAKRVNEIQDNYFTELTRHGRKLELKEKQFMLDVEWLQGELNDFQIDVMELKSCIEKFNLERKEVDERIIEIDLKEKNLAMKSKQYEKRLKELELKEKQFEMKRRLSGNKRYDLRHRRKKVCYTH